jgi:hypothetical protein
MDGVASDRRFAGGTFRPANRKERENMKRKIRALSVAAFAILALGALSASSASATPAQFHSSLEHTELVGELDKEFGEDTFTVNAGTVRCAAAKYTGTNAVKTTTTVTVTPEYSECRAFGFVNATIDHEGCNYLFHAESTTGADPEGSVDIECPVGKSITVTAFNCWVTVGAQTGLKTVTFTNKGVSPTRHITVDVNISSKIKYTQHSKSFPGCSSGTFTNGSYVGAATVKGFSTVGAQADVWYH